MQIIADNIRSLISESKPRLLVISEEQAGQKPGPDAWSKKEILGHLIDSAMNNHQRVVRAGYNNAMDFPPYDQNNWVKVQRYHQVSWNDLISLFEQLNLHFCRAVEILPQECLGNACNIGKESSVTIEFVIQDYLRHLEHHLRKILD
jgi:hypothetical protein